MVDVNCNSWDTDTRLDVDFLSEQWKQNCFCSRSIYDELSSDTKLKISNMVKVVRSKIEGIGWANALTLTMILMRFRLDPKNQKGCN